MDVILLTLSIISGQLVKLPFGTYGGINLLDISVIILCSLGVFRIGLKIRKPPLWIIASLSFIAVALLSLIFTPITLGLNEYFTSVAYAIRFSFYVFLGYLLYLNAFPNLKKNISNIFLLSASILAAIGIVQIIFLPNLIFLTRYGWDPHYFRAVSTFLDPNFLGSFMVLSLILAKKRNLLFAFFYITLLLTFSRGAYLAFLVSFLTLSFFNRSIRMAKVTILLFLLLLGGFFSHKNLVAIPRGIDRQQSAYSRLETWQQGFELFSKHPILGVGFNAYRYALKQHSLGDEIFYKSHGASTNDSSLLFVLSTTGILGLLAYFFLIYSLIRVKKFELIAGLAGLLVQSFFANTLFYPPLLLWIVLMI